MFKLAKLVTTKKNSNSFQKPKNFLDFDNLKRSKITRNFHVSPSSQNFIQTSAKLIYLFKNDPNKWVESPNGLAYAEELVNAQAIDLGSNVFEFTLKNYLQKNEIKSPSLFVRKSQRELWEDVYDASKNSGMDALVFFIGN
jgi:hypothetical protein